MFIGLLGSGSAFATPPEFSSPFRLFAPLGSHFGPTSILVASSLEATSSFLTKEK